MWWDDSGSLAMALDMEMETSHTHEVKVIKIANQDHKRTMYELECGHSGERHTELGVELGQKVYCSQCEIMCFACAE